MCVHTNCCGCWCTLCQRCVGLSSGNSGKDRKLISGFTCSPPVEHRREILAELSFAYAKFVDYLFFESCPAIPTIIIRTELAMVAHVFVDPIFNGPPIMGFTTACLAVRPDGSCNVC